MIEFYLIDKRYNDHLIPGNTYITRYIADPNLSYTTGKYKYVHHEKGIYIRNDKTIGNGIKTEPVKIADINYISSIYHLDLTKENNRRTDRFIGDLVQGKTEIYNETYVAIVENRKRYKNSFYFEVDFISYKTHEQFHKYYDLLS